MNKVVNKFSNKRFIEGFVVADKSGKVYIHAKEPRYYEGCWISNASVECPFDLDLSSEDKPQKVRLTLEFIP